MSVNHGDAPDTKLERDGWVDVLLVGFESAIYWAAFLLLAAASILVIIGGVSGVIQSASKRDDLLSGGVTVLDRVLLVVIVAELAYTLRTVIQDREVVAEPFLLIGIIAIVRRVLIVAAEFERSPSREDVTRLLLEFAGLSIMALSIGGVVFILRQSAKNSVLRHLRLASRE
ncbi:MAG TPA: phosphate-starvation-inducible PsiE family protein [Mycobacterium sp.]|nr:phosphate-starvation-inducible PsiE family protein [Mycobacterium sp.]